MMGMMVPYQIRKLIVSYQPSVEALYQAAMEVALQSEGSQHILIFAGLSERDPASDLNLPSWVPDFRWPSRTGLDPFRDYYGGNAYHAGGIGPDLGGLNDPRFFDRTLIVRAAVLDRIASIGHVFVEEPIETCARRLPWYYWAKWIRQVLDMASPNQPALPGSITFEHLWRTLCASVIRPDGRTPPSSFGDSFTAFQKYYLRSSFEQCSNLLDVDKSIRVDASIPRKVKEQAGAFCDHFMEVSMGRRFSVSRMGRFGLVPRCAQVEDQICVIAGAAVPFIVRRLPTTPGDSPRYHIVGSCYVHGLMSGEALANDRFEKFQDVDFA